MAHCSCSYNFIVIPRRFAYSYVNRSVIDVYRAAHNGISATPYRKHELCLYSQVSTMRIHSCIWEATRREEIIHPFKWTGMALHTRQFIDSQEQVIGLCMRVIMTTEL